MQFQEIERAVSDDLRQCTGGDLSEQRVLDIGCGAGGWLLEFVKWGAKPGNLVGIDALAATAVLFFFFWGVRDGSVSACSITRWLASLGTVRVGELTLNAHGPHQLAQVVLFVLAIPGDIDDISFPDVDRSPASVELTFRFIYGYNSHCLFAEAVW